MKETTSPIYFKRERWREGGVAKNSNNPSNPMLAYIPGDIWSRTTHRFIWRDGEEVPRGVAKRALLVRDRLRQDQQMLNKKLQMVSGARSVDRKLHVQQWPSKNYCGAKKCLN